MHLKRLTMSLLAAATVVTAAMTTSSAASASTEAPARVPPVAGVAVPVSEPADQGGSTVEPAGLGTCTVNANNVRYRTGPGLGYPALGVVHAGQNMDVVARDSGSGLTWHKGYLWGGDGRLVYIAWMYCPL